MTVDLNSGFESHFCRASDGLRLHARLYGDRAAPRPPILCLPGLTRNAKDFHCLSTTLSAGEQPHCVVAVDYRGRGLSDRDPDPGNYTIPIEANDVLAIIDSLGISEACIIGTSRGGLIAMALGVLRPSLPKAVVLNDVGPVIEIEGLLRIRSYLGENGAPASWQEAVDRARARIGRHFPALTEQDWQLFVRQIYTQTPQGLVPDYDPALAGTLASLTENDALPALWPQFDGLATVPLMLVRGAVTDLLSERTLNAMQARRPDMKVLTVEGQGHAPLLHDAPTLAAISAFLCRATGA